MFLDLHSPRRLSSAAACLLLLSACDSATIPGRTTTDAPALTQNSNLPDRPTPPVLDFKAPAYPPLAIYIVYREYVHRYPGITTLRPDDADYQRYMEKRLRELYPARGYAGMMQDAVAEAKRNRLRIEQYERELRDYGRRVTADGLQSTSFSTLTTCESSSVDLLADADPSWTGQEEYAVPPDDQVPTIQMEIDSLQLVGTEVDAIYYYESLATGTYAGGGGGGGGDGPDEDTPITETSVEEEYTRDDLIRAAAEGRTPGEITTQVNAVLIGSVALGIVSGYKYFRVQQAAERAIRKSSEFYPNLNAGDTRRDAHRHIYLSMMLRRYVGATFARMITDAHEKDATGPAKVMDLHNNDIGRTYRYSAFRGHWFWDRWDWGEWAAKVRSYIDDEALNGAYIPEWAALPPPTTDEAWAREACVPDARYIYFSQNPS
jgi:hypothetical protein